MGGVLLSAGDSLRALWHQAGRSPPVTGSLEPRIASNHAEMSDEADAAWGRLAEVLDGLTPIEASAAYDVCCLDQGAERWARSKGKPEWTGMLLVREALEALAALMRGGRG